MRALFKGYGELARLPRPFWILFMATLVNRAGTMAVPFMSIFLIRKGMSAIQVSSVMMAYGLGSLFSAPAAGWLADRFRPFRLLVILLLGASVLMFLFPFVEGFPFLVGFAILLSALNDSFRPVVMMAVNQTVDVSLRKVGIAAHRLAINLGMSVGPLLGGFLAIYSMNGLFYVNGTAMLIAGVIIFCGLATLESVSTLGGVDSSPSPSQWSFFVWDRSYLYFLLASLPISVAFFSFDTTLPLFVVEHMHQSESVLGLMFTLNCLLIIFLEIPLNIATMQWKNSHAIALGSALVAIAFGMLAYIGPWVGWLVLFTLLWTFGEMILIPAASAFVDSISPHNQRGLYMGFYSAQYNLAFILASAGIPILQSAGPRFYWSLVLILGFVSVVLQLKVSNSRAPEAYSSS